MVSNLFQKYLQTLHSQHTTTDHLLSDTHGAMKGSIGVKPYETHDVKAHGDAFDRTPLPESSQDSVLSSKGSTSETTETQQIILSLVQAQSVSSSRSSPIESNSLVQERNDGELERDGGELEKEDSVEGDVLASNGGQAELQAALMRLKEEERKREEDLLREQREREVRIRSNYGCSMQSLTLKTVLTI